MSTRIMFEGSQRTINYCAAYSKIVEAALRCGEPAMAAVCFGIFNAELEQQITEEPFDELEFIRGDCGEVGLFQIMPAFLWDACETELGQKFGLTYSFADHMDRERVNSIDPNIAWFYSVHCAFDAFKQTVATIAYSKRYAEPRREEFDDTIDRTLIYPAVHHRGPRATLEDLGKRYETAFLVGLNYAAEMGRSLRLPKGLCRTCDQ